MLNKLTSLLGLGDVKDELQMFIESQKRKIDNEKRELNKAKAIYSPRDDGIVSSLLVLFPSSVCFEVSQREK